MQVIMNQKKVLIYSTPLCGYCRILKEYLKQHNVEYTDIDLSTQVEKREEMIQKTGQMGVPVLDIEGEIIIGFDKEKINKALGL
jgi:glutaredoxin 3